MNVERLQLMVTMLKEVEAGTWKASKTRIGEIIETGSYNKNAVGYNPSVSKLKAAKTEFDLITWVSPKVYEENKLDCGFSACAVGHASLDPRFNKLGLKPEWGFSPAYKGLGGWEAVEKFFEINNRIASSLFSKPQYPDRLKNQASVIQVRRRIEKLIEIGEEKYLQTALCNYFLADTRLVSPKGRIYKEYK